MELEPEGGEEAPVSPEPEPPAPTGEEATPAGKPEADEDDRDTGDETADEGDEGSPDEGRGGAFDKLLAKYGGDKEKLAAAYFEQANSSARLSERMGAIENYIKGQQKEPEVDEAKVVESDPDVKEIVQEYNDVIAEQRSTETQQNQLIREYGALERKIAQVKGKLEATTEYEAKAEVRAELAELIAEQKEKHSEIRGTQADIKRATQTLKDLTRRYRDAEAKARDGASRQRHEELERQQQAIATRQEFAEAMRAEAPRYGITVGSKDYAVLFQTVNDRLYTYLSRLPKDAPGVNITDAVGVLMKEYGSSLLKGSFKKASSTKLDATSPSLRGPKGTTSEKPAAPPEPKGRQSAQYWKDRAKRLLG